MKNSDKVRYVIGVLFMVGGFSGIMSGDFLAGLFVIIFGASLLPVIYEKLKIESNKNLHIILPIILFVLVCVFMPNTESEYIDNTTNMNVMENIINETTVEKNEIETNTITEGNTIANTEETQPTETNKIENDTVIATVVKNNENKNAEETKKTNEVANTVEPATPIPQEKTPEPVIEKTPVPTTEAKVNSSSSSSSTSQTTTSSSSTTSSSTSVNEDNSSTVYRTPTGKRYHLDPDCGGKNSKATTLNTAISAGLTPCQKCAQ